MTIQAAQYLFQISSRYLNCNDILFKYQSFNEIFLGVFRIGAETATKTFKVHLLKNNNITVTVTLGIHKVQIYFLVTKI